jgi:hypothetical protein
MSKGSRSNAGQSGRIITESSIHDKTTSNGENVVLFEGTFKPQTHLANPAYNPNGLDEIGIPFGTFGAAGGMPIADRPSYSQHTNDGGNSGQVNSFYNPNGRELSMREIK